MRRPKNGGKECDESWRRVRSCSFSSPFPSPHLPLQDFVITWMKVGESVGNYMVKVMGAGNNCTYVLDATCPGKKTRYFKNMQELFDHMALYPEHYEMR